ncbi:hypothetical protein E5D57_000226 [Metarhizium anisopliae]|nr:hypothetical protein E5D57_000226 [Metarhizium anisopliae]
MDVPQADVTFPAVVASLVTVSGVRGCGFPVATIGRPTVATTSPSHGFCQQRRAVSPTLEHGLAGELSDLTPKGLALLFEL